MFRYNKTELDNNKIKLKNILLNIDNDRRPGHRNS